jgi:hypothetical protein
MITNLDRANWADKAILAFREQTGCDHEDSLGDLLGDLMHWAAVRNFDFDAALDRAVTIARRKATKKRRIACSQAVRNLIDAFEQQTERARAVIDSWEQGDLAGAVHGLELSLDESLAPLPR